jgi:Zn-dependent M32 family carboxypeptidase
MNTDPAPSDPEDFEKELAVLRAILRRNLQRLNQDARLGKQLEFWMKSAEFAVTSMEVWEEAGDQDRFDEAEQRMKRVLETLQKLIEQLGDEPGEGNS